MASWSDGAPPAIDVIAKGVESIVEILDIDGDYEENDNAKQKPPDTGGAEFGKQSKNPVRPPGR
jgi:hypothetical protein